MESKNREEAGKMEKEAKNGTKDLGDGWNRGE